MGYSLLRNELGSASSGGTGRVQDSHKELALGYLENLERVIRNNKILDTVVLLPILTLKGKPFTLQHHDYFRPMYRLDAPRKQLWKCGRQMGKSQNLAGAKVLKSNLMKFYTILFVAPRFEQIKRFSSDVVKPLIAESPYIHWMTDPGLEQSILTKTFVGGSKQMFSYAFLDADRIRGIQGNEVNIDEVQDIDITFLPVIAEVMSGSERYRNQVYTGTPKGFDNPIQVLWEDSSMAERAIRCRACNYWNIPSASEDLMKMFGLNGPVCAKCGEGLKPMFNSEWVHSIPDRASTFEGFHLPQPIASTHYLRQSNWDELLHKKDGGYPESKFMNECMGESHDTSEKLCTVSDIVRASSTNKNSLKEALSRVNNYKNICLAIDWTGGGGESKSFTSFALTGIRNGSDNIETLFALKLNKSMGPTEQVIAAKTLFTQLPLQRSFIAHDYTGAGADKEALMVAAGIPSSKIMPFEYVSSFRKPTVEYSTGDGSRNSYKIDKSRSLRTMFFMLKSGKILLPEYNSSKSVTHDLLGLVEEHSESRTGGEYILVNRLPNKPDDFAQALNIGSAALWFSAGGYPKLDEVMRLHTQKNIDYIDPENPIWEEGVTK